MDNHLSELLAQNQELHRLITEAMAHISRVERQRDDAIGVVEELIRLAKEPRPIFLGLA